MQVTNPAASIKPQEGRGTVLLHFLNVKKNDMIHENDLAFPFKWTTREGDQQTESGLTKREYFAAMAMQGLISKYNLKTPEDQDIIAQLSCELSDALIKQLNK